MLTPESHSKFQVEFVNENARQELLSLPKKIRAKAFALLDKMREVGPNLGMPFTRALEKGIFEVRAKGEEGIGRVLFCARIGKRIIVLRCFVKRTQKTPRKEIDIAIARLKELENESC